MKIQSMPFKLYAIIKRYSSYSSAKSRVPLARIVYSSFKKTILGQRNAFRASGPARARMGSNDEETAGSSAANDADSFNIDDFSKDALQKLMLATRNSNELPNAGDDFDYYSSFESFRHLMDMEGSRILQLMQQIIRYHGAKGSVHSANENTTQQDEDRFDSLVDANDQIMERAGTYLDEASGVRKTDTPLVIASMTPKAISGSWNKQMTKKTPESNRSFHLLAAKNIQRPQGKFKDKIDNSNRPFIPVIKDKPNALKSLEESLTLSGSFDASDPSFSYPHPYRYELDHLEPTPDQLKKVKPQNPNPISTTQISMIDTEEDLRNLCEMLSKVKEIAVDVEHHSYRSFLGLTCLLQISTRTHDFLVDALALRENLHLINVVFTDPSIVKVFHGADQDVHWLQRDLGVYIVNLFDTFHASKVLGLPRLSLAYLLTTYCNVKPNKQFQMADWRIRPLPEQLVQYAREDTHYLLYVHELLKNQLLDAGNEAGNLLRSVLDSSTAVCKARYAKPVLTPDSHLVIMKKARKAFNSQQAEALKQIYAWRDGCGRAEDESTGYVLPNHMMLQIAEILPKEPAGILACCNPIPPLVRRNLNELAMIIADARNTELVKPTQEKAVKFQPTEKRDPYNLDKMLPLIHDLSHKKDGVIEIANIDPVQSMKTPAKESAMMQALTQCKKSDLQKSRDIHNDFASPFTKFLPSDEGSTKANKNEMWTILPPSKKPKVSADSLLNQIAADTKVNVSGPLIKFYEPPAKATAADAAEEELDPEKTIREQGGKKKKKKTKADSLKESIFSGIKEARNKTDEQESVQMDILQNIKAARKKVEEVMEEGEDEEKEGFRPFDYSQVQLPGPVKAAKGAKKGKKNKKRKEFDPFVKSVEVDFKPGNKSRTAPATGNRSMMFSTKKGASGNQSWPSK